MTNSVDETQTSALPPKVRQQGTQLNNLAFDPELTAGARNAVKVCLRVQPS